MKKQLKLALVCAAAMTAMTFSLSAQSGGAGFTEAGVSIATQKGSGGAAGFSFQGGYGAKWNNLIYTGIGTGVVADSKFKYFRIPAFLRLKTDFSSGAIRPFLQLDGGYVIPTAKGAKGHAMIHPALGVAYPLASGGSSLYLSAGYLHSFFEGGGIGAMSINVGMSFGKPGGDRVQRTGPSAFGKFLRRTHLELHTGFGYLLSSTPIDDEPSEEEPWLGELKAAWLYDITPSFSAGAGIGIIGKDEALQSFFVRGKWRRSDGKIRPFIALDAGVMGGGENGMVFQIEPKAGLSFMKKNEKRSFDVMFIAPFLDRSNTSPDESVIGNINLFHAGLGLGWTF